MASYEMANTTIKSRKYLIRVSNSCRHYLPAREVKLLITCVETEGAGGRPIEAFTERVPLQWERQELAGSASVTVGPDAYAILFYVQDDGLLKFTTIDQPTNFPIAEKGPKNYWVTLRAISIESDSPPIRYKVVWDGKWEDGESEMRNHINVEIA